MLRSQHNKIIGDSIPFRTKKEEEESLISAWFSFALNFSLVRADKKIAREPTRKKPIRVANLSPPINISVRASKAINNAIDFAA